LNPYLYYHVGLREQDSWVHKDNHQSATQKAIRLMAAGIAKARHLDALQPIHLAAQQHALVIGGGVAGLRCALDVARLGLKVTLIEKSPFLGGRMAQLEKVFPNDEPARQQLHELIQAVADNPAISILTQAEVAEVSGYVGDFHIQIKQDSRGVDPDEAETLMQACEETIPDPYDYGLSQRKLIYRAYDGCYPSDPAVDWAHCQGDRLEVQVDGRTVTLVNQPQMHSLNVGAVVVATGFDVYQPAEGEYGYGELPEVVTLPQLIRHLATLKETDPLVWNGQTVKSMALIHCVGSRQIDGVHPPQPDGEVNPYCSRVCCTASLHLLNEVHERFPDVDVFDIYQDIRTYGRGHETYYRQALEDRVRFIRYRGEEIPDIKASTEAGLEPVMITVNDTLTYGESLEVPVDLVVLAVGMMPRAIDDLIHQLKISRGSDRFLLEVHPKLRPVETAVPGVFLAGTAQGPMNIQESCAAAQAAAAKVGAMLGLGAVELEPYVAVVDTERCQGSGQCIAVCQYEDAIQLVPRSDNGREGQVAQISPANCSGCGACVSACPEEAINVQGWTLEQYRAMVRELTASIPMKAEV
jgi:heterodisulfide reductase subunit A